MVLTEWQRLELGGVCEREFKGRAMKLAIDDVTDKAIPNRLYEAWDKRGWGDIWSRAKGEIRPSPEEAAAVGAQVFGTRKRLYSARLRRPPRSVREEVMGMAMTYALDKFGVAVSKRYVRTCWDEFKALERRIEQEADREPPAT